MAVTTPLAETVATVRSVLAHAMARPVSASPVALVVVAASCSDPPGRSAALPCTATVPTGTGCTVMVAVPVTVSLVAVMVADSLLPPSTRPAVTVPVAPTVATVGLLLLQVTVRPARVPPLVPVRAADSACVAPLAMVALGGETTTSRTGSGGSVVQAARSSRRAMAPRREATAWCARMGKGTKEGEPRRPGIPDADAWMRGS